QGKPNREVSQAQQKPSRARDCPLSRGSVSVKRNSRPRLLLTFFKREVASRLWRGKFCTKTAGPYHLFDRRRQHRMDFLRDSAVDAHLKGVGHPVGERRSSPHPPFPGVKLRLDRLLIRHWCKTRLKDKLLVRLSACVKEYDFMFIVAA